MQLWWIHDQVPEGRTNDPSTSPKLWETLEDSYGKITEKQGIYREERKSIDGYWCWQCSTAA